MRKILILLMAVSTALFTTSCQSVNFDFPPDIKDECYGAKNSSKRCAVPH